ncbi:hypothetical protein [Rhizobium paknamense]|uniref:Uncharacterized protein n=1 Tax=Rhizobium paknamense TaxID=1206817 RepID=A0ABU0I7J6_9HYPH|nr:hypothetical protein [Rhizobium paknamense]MDQ0454196.1 hypothetical protein [Rhizobium paknamense]
MEKQVIEYGGVPVGISVPEGNRIKFIAVKYPVIELDGGVYGNVTELRRAIGNHLRKSSEAAQALASVSSGAGTRAKALSIA